MLNRQRAVRKEYFFFQVNAGSWEIYYIYKPIPISSKLWQYFFFQINDSTEILITLAMCRYVL